MSSRIEQSYRIAKEIYAEHGINADNAIAELEKITIGIHAWQGDDVRGFEAATAHALTGGCQVTGNHPGVARTADELRADLDAAMKLIPGKVKIGLQGHEVDKMVPGVDRDAYTIENFSGWLDWAKDRKIGMDIAPAFYSHPMLDHNLSVSHPDPAIRKFWIGHGQACRRISEIFARELGVVSVCNQWFPDGFKDIPCDRQAFRDRLRDALDEIFSDPVNENLVRDAVEPKLFGIGVESCTVGSHDFYASYAAKRNKLICIDSGHFHPTEQIGDKISAFASNGVGMLLHVSRGVRWDSDHIVLLDDSLLSIARETIQARKRGAEVHLMLDYFDGSVNRIGAWAVGSRALAKGLLIALLEPTAEIAAAEGKLDYGSRMIRMEAAKTLPWQAVWEYYCAKHDCPDDFALEKPLDAYEAKILAERK